MLCSLKRTSAMGAAERVNLAGGRLTLARRLHIRPRHIAPSVSDYSVRLGTDGRQGSYGEITASYMSKPTLFRRLRYAGSG